MAPTSSSAKETAPVRPPPIALRHEEDVDDDALEDESPMRDGRNENSLAYLCQRFCEMYQNHSEPINIDLAAKELGIQRRRMYEILNIIQSVGLVGRLRASFYRWDGYDKMAVVLERLKEEGMARLAMTSRSGTTSSTAASGNPGCLSPEGQRRKAVATALGERFVQIFLCNEVPQPVILEDIMGLFASCVSGGAAAALTNQTSCARRLYDIANVFCSIGLVRKSCAPATDNRRKKRLYDWTGPVPTATTTPLRPARLTLTAPTASPGSGSVKRVKRETGGLDTPRSSHVRKKSRSHTSLEASIRQADEQDEDAVKTEPSATLQHPAVAALRGARLVPELNKSRAMLVARTLEPPVPSALSSLAAASLKASTTSLFHPLNAKDRCLSPLTARGIPVSQAKTTTTVSDATVLSSMATASSSSTTTTTCSCSTSTALTAQVEQLKKELQDAKAREQELRRRVDAQDAQIKSLSSRSSTSGSSFLLNAGSSPLTNLAFSPFQGSLARDAFASLSASPFPTNHFFSPASASRSGRGAVPRKAARIGPHLIDPTGDDQELLPAASPHLSPGTTSIASSLLLSPPVTGSSDKENRLVAAARQGQQLELLSPLRVRTLKAEAGAAPSTPPTCHLIATAASSLLSLTPSQVPFSMSLFGDDASDTESEVTVVKHEHETVTVSASNQDDNDTERANAASPEPEAVRSLAAPSSPSPSAKSLARHAIAHPKLTPSSSSPAVSSTALAASLEEFTPRVAGCLS